MSRRGVIETEQPQQCDLCGVIAELRPYGPNGEKICIDCADKNPEAQVRGAARLLLGLSMDDDEVAEVLRHMPR